MEIVGEAASVEEARALGPAADAYLVAVADPEVPSLPASTSEPLTPREEEVLRLLVDGLSNKTIAGRLRISDQTVKFHVASIVGKLGATNRTAAVRLAIRRGLVDV
jgi:DNA-binding NarL/FixJ family response regulator